MLTQLILNGIIAGGTYSLVAVGFALIYRTTRFFNFAHGAIYTLGPYFAYLLYIQVGLPQILAFLLAALATSVVGVGCEVFVYKPMRNRGATDLTLLIASLGLYIVLQNAISLVWGDDTRTMRTAPVAEGHKFLGAYITDIQAAIILTSFILILALGQLMSHTRFGTALRALANDHELAKLSGIDSDQYIAYAFAIGSFLAAVAGILISFDTDMVPTMGFNALVMGIIAVIIGGLRSMQGAWFGGLIIGLVQNLSVWKLPSKWQDTIAFLIFVMFLLFRPYGMLGKKPQKAHV